MNLDSLVRDVNPARLDTVPGPESLEGRAILEQLGTESPVPRRRPVIVGGLTLGSLATAAGAVVLVTALLPGSPAPPSPAAAATLENLAYIAAGQPALIPAT